MPTYECKECNFSSDRLNDYNRHLNTPKHARMSLTNSTEKNMPVICQKVSDKYICNCGKKCASRQSLWYHEKVCNFNDNNEKIVIEELEHLLDEKNIEQAKLKLLKLKEITQENSLGKKPKKVNKTKNIIDNITNTNGNNILTDSINNTLNNSLTNNSNNTLNNNINTSINNTLNTSISVTNYIKNTYPPTEPLMLLTEDEVEKLLEMTPKQSGGYSLGELVVFYYGKHLFGQFVGDFIVRACKKLDPKYQKFWASDVQRLTFLIQRAFNGGEVAWVQDKKGISLTKLIIDPVIDTVKNKVIEFKEICKKITSDPNKDSSTIEKFFNYGFNAEKLLYDIGIKESHKSVLRYIASEFQVQLN
jgi:hypothetical protein